MIGLAVCRSDGKPAVMLYDGAAGTVARTSIPFASIANCASDLGSPGFDLESCRTGDWQEESTQRFLPPVDPTAKVLCVAQNFSSHAREVGGEESPPSPVIFLKPFTAFVGHRDDTLLPEASTFFDYEAELVAVLGRSVWQAGVEEAAESVAAYTIANDGTARDLQPIDIGGRQIVDWFSAKSIDHSSALGPALFPAHRMPPLDHVQIRCFLNDSLVQEDAASSMTRSPAELISHVSRLVRLNPGDMILTGTPAGVGKARGRRLESDDALRVVIDPLGALETRMVSAPRS